ncbi:MAG: DUF366 family protein [Methanobrevibacter sp.]|nr:DUF366 family protein [Methanobrevibacter sp.]
MEITHKHINKALKYDGSQIEKSWAFKSFGIKGSSIITWIGPMDIYPEHLKDFEDINLEIKSDNMIHFIVEHFDIQPANLRIAYMRQRLLVMILKEELAKKGINSIRKGDDIYIISNSKEDLNEDIDLIESTDLSDGTDLNVNIDLTEGIGFIDGADLNKLTVSIATVSISSMKIHLGINLSSDGTPDDIDTIGLFELANKIFNNDNLMNLINNIVTNYINELIDIELDISKTNLL